MVGFEPGAPRGATQDEQVAPTDSTVLVYGETGTGKELIAARDPQAKPAPRASPREGELQRHLGRSGGERAFLVT